MSTAARPGRCRPKKSHVQPTLSPSCAPKSASASRAPEKPRPFQTSQAAAAIIPYRTVHTGAKTHPGGVQAGFASPAYHSPTGNRPAKSAAP